MPRGYKKVKKDKEQKIAYYLYLQSLLQWLNSTVIAQKWPQALDKEMDVAMSP